MFSGTGKKRNEMCLLLADPRGRLLSERGKPLQMRSFRVWNNLCLQGPWDLVLDIGANYGEMIFFSDLSTDQDIICVEPNEEIVPYLVHNLQRFSRAVVKKIAVGCRNETAYLSSGMNHSGRNFVSYQPNDKPIRVVPLEDLLKGENLKRVLVKIDIEGGEFEVLQCYKVHERVSVVFFAETHAMNRSQIATLLDSFYFFDIDSNIRPILQIDSRNLESWISDSRRGMNAILISRDNFEQGVKITVLRSWWIFLCEVIASCLFKLNIRD
jgi:FkbM family methyltransferase